MTDESPTIWTIGHSTRSAEEFGELLTVNHIEVLVDVRRHAGSRKFPHFNPDALRESLARISIDYLPMPDLGGRRRARPDSQNTIWRNASFRGYADYMETEEFGAAAEHLQALAAQRPTIMMCAEAVWWRQRRGRRRAAACAQTTAGPAKTGRAGGAGGGARGGADARCAEGREGGRRKKRRENERTST